MVSDSMPFFMQPERGYRFGTDSIALAEFIQIGPGDSLLDLGTGIGVIPILVWRRHPFRVAVGVELQAELVKLARTNVELHQLSSRVFILERDVSELTATDFSELPLNPPLRNFEVISANPPFWALGSGRISHHEQKAVARHEIRLNLHQLIQTSQRLLASTGRLYLVYRAERESAVVEELKEAGFSVLRKKYIPFREKKRLYLLEAGWDR